MKRKCGRCTVCCTVLKVEELDKAAWETCGYACEKCMIYDTRPKACSDFVCAWLDGSFGGVWDRPDLSGILIYRDDGSRIHKDCYIIIEVWENALEHQKENLNKLKEKFFLYIARFGETNKRIFSFPPDRVEEGHELMRKLCGDILA